MLPGPHDSVQVVTTFIHKGLLNPPSGVEDGLSLGTLSRHVDAATESMTIYNNGLITYHLNNLNGPVWVDNSQQERPSDSAWAVDVVLVGDQTNISVVLSIPRADFTAAGGDDMGPVDYTAGSEGGAWWDDWNIQTIAAFETAIEAENSGWTVAITDNGDGAGTWTVQFTRAALAAGTHTIYLRYDGPFIANKGLFFWAYSYAAGTSGTLGGPHNVVATGGSTEDPTATGFTEAIYVAMVEATVSAPATSPPSTAFQFTATITPRGAYTQTKALIQIEGDPTCAEPTLVSNPDGHTIGAWTNPPGDYQWSCEITSIDIGGGLGASTSIVFEASATGTGILGIGCAGAWYDDSIQGPVGWDYIEIV